MTKNLYQWALAAILICGVTTFTSCTNEDNPTDPAANLSEMIIGKWVVADLKGVPALTNEKMITTFVSPTKAIAVHQRLISRKRTASGTSIERMMLSSLATR